MQRADCVKLKNCRLCNSSKLKKVLNLGSSQLANSYTKKYNKKLKKYPLELNLCKDCGHLQLGHLINPKLMFSNYLYQTNTSKTNYLHFKNYANEILKLKKGNFKILDIASNDGTFLSFFKNKLCLGIDPAKNLKKIANAKGINQISDFFTYKNSFKIKKKYKEFDFITANHVCAHVNDLKDFFLGVKNLLNSNGLFIFEISYRGSVLKKNTFDTIYHEHIDYHALKPLNKFAKRLGLYLYDYQLQKAQGGSLRVFLTKNKNIINLNRKIKINNFIKKETHKSKLFNEKTYLQFENKIHAAKKKLNKILIIAKRKGLNIAGYGAAAKTTTLLNYFNIKDNQINFIIDDNPLKQNHFMPGKNIKITSSKILLKKNINLLLIFAWNYSDYIIKKNYIFKRNGGKFIVPFPEPKLIN
jgi:2-polyprenyl-3-methyl-5-hydroxy-6-metoxy-1,4-benzoquinol methylase